MHPIQFHVSSDDDSSFYALASSAVSRNLTKSTSPAMAVLYFSPSKGFSRFSVHAFDEQTGQQVHYHRGPIYSSTPEAALLDFWEALSIPVYCWRLFPLGNAAIFRNSDHEIAYLEARHSFCQAIYIPRSRAYSMRRFGATPFFSAPENGFNPVNAHEISEENSEIFRAFSVAPSDNNS